MVYYFKEEIDNHGLFTNRIEYNSIFSKTAQGGAKKLTESKWLITNKNVDLCPVRLYHKVISKRGNNVKTDKMFLTPNKFWNLNESSNWFKNSPVGTNEIAKWVKIAAEETGLDVKKRKISNHSIRSTAVSTLAKAGVGEHQLMKITGHSNSHSIKSYLQLDSEHHQEIVEKMRTNVVTTTTSELSDPNQSETSEIEILQKEGTGFLNNCSNVSFSNCTFNFVQK